MTRANNALPSRTRKQAAPWEPLCLTVFLALIGWQLFVFPVTGLSDNNDFPKVFGPAHICKAPPEDLNTWFVTGYEAGPRCEWPSGFTSSEILFVNLARFLSRPFTGRYYFDIRASAAVHLLILAVAMGLFLSVTRRQPPLVRFLLPPLAILMFTDVAYVAYLNSAYMDNASWVLFLLLTSIAATEHPWSAPAYAITGVLLVFSKAQHAVLGIPFAFLAAWFAWRGVGRAPSPARSPLAPAWLFAALALLAATAVMPNLTPPQYQTISLYNLIFYRLAPADRTVLDQLGLDSTYQKWVGTEAFSPGSPLSDPDWTHAFLSQTSFSDVALLYVRHPGIALREVDRELHDSVHAIRPDYMANYRQADGFPPHTVATRFSLWSSLRGRVLADYPYFLVVLYCLPLVLATLGQATGRRSPVLQPLALTLLAAGVSEFAICTLADAIDTHRHLFLFHVITDTVILLTVGWILVGRRELP